MGHILYIRYVHFRFTLGTYRIARSVIIEKKNRNDLDPIINP